MGNCISSNGRNTVNMNDHAPRAVQIHTHNGHLPAARSTEPPVLPSAPNYLSEMQDLRVARPISPARRAQATVVEPVSSTRRSTSPLERTAALSASSATPALGPVARAIVARFASQHTNQFKVLQDRAGILRESDAWRIASSGNTNEAVRRLRTMLENNENSLNWSNLQLTTLPACLGQLRQLEKLDVSNNLLTELPDEIGQLQNLNELDAQKNRLDSLTGAITQLANLKRLILENNHLTLLPSQLDRMTALRELRVSKNRLDGLTDEIASLPALLELNAADNRISHLPARLFEQRAECLMHLQNNLINQDEIVRHRQTIVLAGYRGPRFYLKSQLVEAVTLSPNTANQDPISSRLPEQRLQLLLEAASHLNSKVDEEQQLICLGDRSLTRKDCFLMALEIALVHQRELIPVISHHLIHDFPSDIQRFEILGTNLNRGQINDWAWERDLPVKTSVDVVASNVENQMRDVANSQWRSNQNVHETAALVAGARQLNRIKEQVRASKSLAQTETEINDWLRNNNAPPVALASLHLLMTRIYTVEGFSESPASTMALLWTHIENTNEQPLKANLLASMLEKLIAIRYVCTTGMIQNIIDIPSAIDWSLTSAISPEQLRNEMMQLAAEVNEEFEMLYGDQAQQPAAVQPYVRPRPIDLSERMWRGNISKAPTTFSQCESLLISAIESGQGIFQFISCAKQYNPSATSQMSIIELVDAQKIGEQDTNIQLSNRYHLESFERLLPIIGTINSAYQVAQLTVHDRDSGEQSVIPFTQVSFNFKGKILRAEYIERADEILNHHMLRISSSNVKNAAPKPIMVTSTGTKRNMILLCFNEIKRGIHDGVVNESNIDNALAQAAAAFNAINDSRSRISATQISELKTSLERELEKVHQAQREENEMGLVTSNIKRQMFQLKAKVQLVILRGLGL